VRRHHHVPGQPAGHLGAAVGAQQVQAEVHPGGAAAGGQHVAVVYNATMTKGGDEAQVGGMDVYRVVDGEITEMWNGGDKQGLWL